MGERLCVCGVLHKWNAVQSQSKCLHKIGLLSKRWPLCHVDFTLLEQGQRSVGQEAVVVGQQLDGLSVCLLSLFVLARAEQLVSALVMLVSESWGRDIETSDSAEAACHQVEELR